VKIFLLPKITTQSPRGALTAGAAALQHIPRPPRHTDVAHENACGTGASCTLAISLGGFSRISRSNAPTSRRVAGQRALCIALHTRQYFLKRDSVFFDVLVYSGCSAFRFPSARSD
jgi:hypothetical protein